MTAHGDKKRGFGFLHDASIHTFFHFPRATGVLLSDTERMNIEQFVSPSIPPLQATLTSTNAAAVNGRINLMIWRAMIALTLAGQPQTKECDLLVNGNVAGEARGYLINPRRRPVPERSDGGASASEGCPAVSARNRRRIVLDVLEFPTGLW